MSSNRAATIGQLRESGWESVPVKTEIRRNAIARMQAGEPLVDAVLGYEDTVLPQLENAILAGHDVIFLGERGQAKTRMIRSLTALLDEWMPIVAGSTVNGDGASGGNLAGQMYFNPTAPETVYPSVLGLLMQYMGRNEVGSQDPTTWNRMPYFECQAQDYLPTYNRNNAVKNGRWFNGAVHFGAWNATGDIPFKTNRTVNPSTKVVMMCDLLSNRDAWVYFRPYWKKAGLDTVSSSWEKLSGPHNGGSGFLYMDGHAANQRFGYWMNPNMTKVRISIFNPYIATTAN